MRKMAEIAYSECNKNEKTISLLGDIVENITQMIFDLLDVEKDKTFTFAEQEKIIKNILMYVFDDFVSFSFEKNVENDTKFLFEKYGVKLYLLIRKGKNFDFANDKDLNDKLSREREHLLK